MSLAKIDAKLSTLRRDLTAKIESRDALFAKVDTLSDAIDALQAKDSLSAEDQTALDAKLAEYKTARLEATKQSDAIRAAQSEIADLETQRAERVEANLQSAALTAGQTRRTTAEPLEIPEGKTVNVSKPSVEQIDYDLNCYLQNAVVAKQNNMSIAAVSQGALGDQYKNDRLAAQVLVSNNPSLIPTNFSDRLIELLRPMTVIRSLPGVVFMPLENGNLTIPRQTGTGTASWQGEMVNSVNSSPTTDNIVLQAKKLRAQTIQSGEMVRRSSPASMTIVRDDILRRTALAMDLAFLRNTANLTTTPKGLKWFADQNPTAGIGAGVVRAAAGQALATVTADIGRLILKLRNANVPFVAPIFIMSPRIERFLMDLRDGNGNYAFPEMTRGLLRQYPYRVTTQIPDNLTVDTAPNSSELYFVDASEIIIGDTPTFNLRMSDVAAYHDGSAVQSAFSQDAVVYQLITETDLQARHNESIAYMEKVTWA